MIFRQIFPARRIIRLALDKLSLVNLPISWVIHSTTYKIEVLFALVYVARFQLFPLGCSSAHHRRSEVQRHIVAKTASTPPIIAYRSIWRLV
jgi:hypothetical protein